MDSYGLIEPVRIALTNEEIIILRIFPPFYGLDICAKNNHAY